MTDLIARLAAALALDDPERALAAVVAAVAGGEPADAGERAIAADLVRAAHARAAAHDEHRRARERMDLLSAASFEGIMVHVDGVIIDANERVAEMLGYTRDEMIGQPILRLCVAPEDLEGVLRRVRDRVEGSYVITGVRKDGSRFRAELSSKQGHLGDRPVRIAAVRDVTDREQTLALLRESEERLRELVAGTFDFFVYSRDGIIIRVGGRIQETLGFPAAHFIGRPVIDLVTPSMREASGPVIIGGVAGVFETIVVDARGEPVPVEVVRVMSTLDGEPVRIGAARDLRAAKQRERERRNLERRVERGQRLESLGVLAGGIAHDFNNLLVGVLGNASVLLERATDPIAREAAEAIAGAGRQAASLTARMLSYAGQDDLTRREPIELGALLDELRGLLAAALSKKAQLALAIGPGSVVVGDRATLTQVLVNLLTNASDALRDRPGRISVTTRRVRELDERWDGALGATPAARDWVLVEVRDDGIGMDAATRERVFEPFFTTKQQGHGLGLAACFGIVTSHAGAIVVESEPGAGSCFSVALPAGELVAAPIERTAASRAGIARKVLVVDDEQMVRKLVRRALELRGHVVVEAADGTSALAMFAEAAADVMVIDLTMPDLDGLEVVKRIRASGSQLPVVLSSGYLNVLADRPAESQLIDQFLTKPFTIPELVAAIEAAIARVRPG